MYYMTTCPSPLGELTLACGEDGGALVGLWLEGQKYYGGSIAHSLTPGDGLPIFAETEKWLKRYFAGEKPEPSELPLAPIGSEFRQSVWRMLLSIPRGETRTYGGLARELALTTGRKVSAQAVGGAVGHNPISIIIPCHRVVGADGSLTGYAGGVDKKIKLLELEGADMSRLFPPKC